MVRSLRGRRGAGAHCKRHAGRERPHDVHGERRAILSRTNRRLTPKSQLRERLSAGQVGFGIAGIKTLTAAKVGDTVTLAGHPASAPLPGFKEAKPQVFAGLYPI